MNTAGGKSVLGPGRGENIQTRMKLELGKQDRKVGSRAVVVNDKDEG